VSTDTDNTKDIPDEGEYTEEFPDNSGDVASEGDAADEAVEVAEDAPEAPEAAEVAEDAAEEVPEAAEDAVEVPEAAEDAEATGVTPRRVFTIIAVILGVILVALLVYLFLLLTKPGASSAESQAERAGLVPLLVLDGPGKGPKPAFKQPMSAAWGPGGRIYVADTGNSRIVVFDRSGKFLFEFGTFGIAKPLPGQKATWKPGSLDYPTGIAIDQSNGDVYVADFYNNTIEVFDRSGKYLRNFPDPNQVTGKGGSGINGRGIAVTDVAVSGDLVYATDAFQILVFDRSGRLLKQFGKPGGAAGDLDRPNGIMATSNGGIIVSDSNHSRVTEYNALGKAVRTIGEQVRELSSPTTNPFVLPRGITRLTDGSLLVADPLSVQLVRIRLDGTVVRAYGDRGESPAQFNFPNDVDADGKTLVVADRGNNRVQVVRIVGK
jgi:DNA-binding beta-propeller fold protein YncE